MTLCSYDAMYPIQWRRCRIFVQRSIEATRSALPVIAALPPVIAALPLQTLFFVTQIRRILKASLSISPCMARRSGDQKCAAILFLAPCDRVVYTGGQPTLLDRCLSPCAVAITLKLLDYQKHAAII